MQLKQHPLSAAFPAMSDEEFAALCDDIEDHGQREPIVIHEDMVLDGWHRYSACLELGRTPQTVPFGDDDPVKYVLSRNLHRRHLTASQRAMAVISCNQWAPANRPKNKQAPGASLLKTNKDLAQEAGTGVRTVVDAKTALKAGIGDAVTQGVMTAKQAAQVVRGTPEKAPGASPAKPPTKAKDQPTPAIDPALVAKLEDTQQAVAILSEDNDRLSDRLAVVAMDATEEERAAAAETIGELRAKVRTLEIELDAVKSSRDSLMRENNELKSQCARQRKQLEKLKATV